MTSGKAVDEREQLDPAVEAVPIPVWSAAATRPFHSLSDVRREQSAVYWLWRKHGRLTVGQMQAATIALRCVGTVMEAERDTRVAELEEKVRHLEEMLEQRAKQPQGSLPEVLRQWVPGPQHSAKPS